MRQRYNAMSQGLFVGDKRKGSVLILHEMLPKEPEIITKVQVLVVIDNCRRTGNFRRNKYFCGRNKL